MNYNQFLDQVRSGKIFTIEFIKRTTGENRVMNARLGVKAHVKGVGRSFVPDNKNLLGVFDMQKQAYRFVSLECLIGLKLNGKEYSWNQENQEFIEIA